MTIVFAVIAVTKCVRNTLSTLNGLHYLIYNRKWIMSFPQTLTLKAFAKINLSLDITGILENGYHQLEMIMQSVSLHDKVTITTSDASQGISLLFCTFSLSK